MVSRSCLLPFSVTALTWVAIALSGGPWRLSSAWRSNLHSFLINLWTKQKSETLMESIRRDAAHRSGRFRGGLTWRAQILRMLPFERGQGGDLPVRRRNPPFYV